MTQSKKANIYTNKHKKVIEKLKKAREDSGLNQNDVAKKLGRTQSYISKIESGQRKVDIVQLQELAVVYKKKINDFLP